MSVFTNFLSSRVPLTAIRLFHFSVVLLFVSGCATSHKLEPQLTGEITHQGIIEPFEKIEYRKNGKPISFEPSSVYVHNSEVFLVSDKPLTKDFPSPMVKFSIRRLTQNKIGAGEINPIKSVEIANAKKIEAMTISLDGSTVFATTSFSYFGSNAKKNDPYSTILYWPVDHPEQAKIINPVTRNGVTSSRGLHQQIKRILRKGKFRAGPNYFKIEGLSIMPNNRLLFGIRSSGDSYKSSRYNYVLLDANIVKDDDNFSLKDFRKVYEYDSTNQTRTDNRLLTSPVGISSLEYSEARNGLFILTSYETSTRIGGYLWFLSLEDLEQRRPPTLVRKPDGEPIHFAHKPEGLWVLAKNQLLVIHDDDRSLLPVKTESGILRRNVNHGVFSLIQLNNLK